MKYPNLFKSVLLLLPFSLLVVACDDESASKNKAFDNSTLMNGVPPIKKDSVSEEEPAMDTLPYNDPVQVSEPNSENDPEEMTKDVPVISKNKSADKLSENTVTKGAASKEACYLKVSFYSKGAGIDGKTQEKFDTWIKSYQQKNKLQVAHTMKPWGREGEIDYCFKLTNMTVQQRNAFIAAAKKQVGGKELVRIETELK